MVVACFVGLLLSVVYLILISPEYKRGEDKLIINCEVAVLVCVPGLGCSKNGG